MSTELWGRVDDYIVDKLVDEDAALADALQANAAGGLRPIDVSAAQGKFLHLLVRISGARRVLEIGTLGAYSTIWMARALPAGGSIITLEYEPHHAEVARRNIERAGYSDRIEVRLGAAAETLPILAAEQPEPFDFVFIDADKPNNPTYLDWAVRLGRPGTVIVLDNVVRDGEVANAASRDP
ncbi:MAG: O-methyltransferase, partial [Devosia sp.]|nr:O-methyltransferase [Devosia sp.]